MTGTSTKSWPTRLHHGDVYPIEAFLFRCAGGCQIHHRLLENPPLHSKLVSHLLIGPFAFLLDTDPPGHGILVYPVRWVLHVD